MANAASAASGPDDATLLNTVRTGDDAAFEALYKRHVRAVRLLAIDLVASPAEADHLVAETFALVLDVTKRGGGPTDAFRPYMLTALRRVAASQVRGQAAAPRSDKQQVPDVGEPLVDATVATLDGSLITRAYLSLPERWQAVLWHVEIEQARPADVAALFAADAAGVSTLRDRAADGLQQAYLRMYIPRATRPECGPVAERFGGHLRNSLSRRSAGMVSEHLAACAECAAACAELADLGVALRSQVAPVVLGRAGDFYLAGIAAADALAVAGPGDGGDPATAALAVAALAAELAGPGPGRRWVAVGVGTVIVAIGLVFAVVLAAHRAPAGASRHHRLAAAGTSFGVSTTAAGQPSVPARKSSTPSAPAASRSPKTSATVPSPDVSQPSSPSPSPAPTAQLAASISVSAPQGRGNFAQVAFTVTDTGSAATGEITASITLPSGSWFPGHGHHWGGGPGGWNCQPDASGATCQHPAISAGSQAQGMIFIVVGGSACGQSVQLTATSGGSSASAESGAIDCSGGPGG